MSAVRPPGEGQSFSRDMTVAHIRERQGGDSLDVMFLESARIYKLPRAHPGFQRMLERLREAIAEHRTLTVRVASEHSDVIEDVAPRKGQQ